MNNEKEAIKTVNEKLRNLIFKSFDIVLENRRISVNLAIFLIVINYTQMIAMSFNSFNVHINKSLIKNFLFISDYLLVYYELKLNTMLAFNFFANVLCTCFLLFLITGFIYINETKRKNDIFINEFSNVLAFLFDCFDLVCFIPFMGTLILNMTCFDQSICYSTIHIILIFWSIILIIVMMIIEFLYVSCFFNFNFKMNDALSKNPSNLPFVFLMIKFIIITISVIFDLTSNGNYNLLLIVHIGNGALRMFDALLHFPYHHKNVAKVYGSLTAAYLWVNSSMFLLNVVTIELLQDNSLVVIGLGLLFLVKLFLNIRNFKIKVLIISELDEINSDIHLDLKLRYYNTLAKTLGIKKSELLLASLLKIHNDKCEISDCCCKSRNNLYDPHKYKFGENNLQFHKDEVFIKHYILKMITNGIEKFNNSKLLYLDYIFYSFEALRTYAQIYYFIHYFKLKFLNNLSFSIEFCIFRIFQHLKRFLEKKNEVSGLNKRLLIENVKKFDKGLITLKLKIHQSVELYEQIWGILSENMPDLSVLLNNCNKCIQKNNEVVSQYNYLVNLNDQSQKLRNLMEIYCFYICHDDLLYFKIDKEIKIPYHMEIGDSLNQDIHYLLNKYNMFDENVGTIIISPSLETVGQIIWVSSNIPKLFHYDSMALKTMNINTLMPELIGKYHDKILKSFYKTGKENAINNFRHLWGIDKHGFCFSLNILIKIIPNENNFEIMSLIHKLNENDYIITNHDGEISCLGKKISDYLEITPESLLYQKINIQVLAPRLVQLFKKIFIETNETVNAHLMLNPISQNMAQKENTEKTTTRKKQGSKIDKTKGTDERKIVKFYLFLPHDMNDILKFNQEQKENLKKLENMNKTNKDKAGKDIKFLIEMKKNFGTALKNTFNQIDLTNVKKVLRVKASISHHKFANGNINFVAFKWIYCEVKRPDLISYEKRMKQTKYIKVFLRDIKKIEKNINTIGENALLKEKEEKEDLNNAKDNKTDNKTKNKIGNKMLGMLKMNNLLNPKKEDLKKQPSISTSKKSGADSPKQKETKNIKLPKLFQAEKEENEPESIIGFKPKRNLFGNALFKIKQTKEKEESKEELKITENEMEKKKSLGFPLRNPSKIASIIKTPESISQNTLEKDNKIETEQKPLKLGGFLKNLRNKEKIDPQPQNPLPEEISKKPSFLKQSSSLSDTKINPNQLQKGITLGKNPLNILNETDNSNSPPASPKKPVVPKLSKPSWAGHLRNVLLNKGLMNKKTENNSTSKNKKHDDSESVGSQKVSLQTDSLNNSSSSEDEKSAELQMLLKSEKGNSTIQRDQNEKQDLLERLEQNRLIEDEEQIVSVASSAFSTVAQNSLKTIKDSLKKQKANKMLRFSNYIMFGGGFFAFLLVIIQYIITKDKINIYKLELEKVNGISFYNENFLQIYNVYFTLYALELNLGVNNPIWRKQMTEKLRNSLKILIKFSFAERIEEARSPLKKDYLFYEYLGLINVQGKKMNKSLNFQDFFLIFINSVNNTLEITDFSLSTVKSNDYLSFIFDNFELAVNLIKSNNEFLDRILKETCEELEKTLLIMWLLVSIIIGISFSIVFPIIFKTKTRILNTLALFTKIPLKDVDFYNSHYKQIKLNLTRIDDSVELLKIIQQQTESNKKILLIQKKNDGNVGIRTRKYKGINVEKYLYVLCAILLTFIFSGIIIAKDIQLYTFVHKTNQLNPLYLQQHQIVTNSNLYLIRYKQAFIEYFINKKIDKIILDDFNIHINLNPSKLASDIYTEFSLLDYDFKTFFSDLITLELCEILNSINSCVYFDPVYCKKDITLYSSQISTTFLMDNVWGTCEESKENLESLEGTLNYFVLLENKLINQAYLIEKLIGTDNAESELRLNFMANQDWKLIEDLNRFTICIRKWYYLCFMAIKNKVDIELEINIKILVVFVIFLWFSLILIWWRKYIKLVSDSKWVNGFIILLPLHLIKENQHLKLFLKKKIKVGNIDK